MAFKLSMGLRNSLLGSQDAVTGTDFVFATAGNTITTSAQDFLAEGFRPGDTITITGTSTNDSITTITSLTATVLTVAAVLANESPASATITSASRAMKDILRNNIIHIYSGSAPADADAAEVGVLLLKITKASGAVVPGVAANGNNFDAIVDGVLSKDSEAWSGVGLANGTAGYWRCYDNGEVTGASTTSKRCEGLCALSGATFIMSSTTIVSGATITLDTFNITQPAV